MTELSKFDAEIFRAVAVVAIRSGTYYGTVAPGVEDRLVAAGLVERGYERPTGRRGKGRPTLTLTDAGRKAAGL